MKIANSERLSFRLMDDTDFQLLWELDQDPEVMKFINGGTPTSMDDIHKVFIPRMYKYRSSEKGWGIWKVSLTETEEYLGWIIVRPMHFFSDNPAWNDIELGWRFMRSSWGKGYATEAAKAIMNEVATQPEVNQFSAIAQEDNYGSINIMRKLGMKFVKKDLHKDPLGDAELVYYSVAV